MTAIVGFSYPIPSEKEKAEAKVRKLIPELMELSFGCELKCNDHPDFPNTVRRYAGERFSKAIDGYIRLVKEESSSRLYPIDEEYDIIGHPIQLQHWLRVLDEKKLNHEKWYFRTDGRLMYNDCGAHFEKLRFNLTTGQPATEADYKAFNDIVGI